MNDLKIDLSRLKKGKFVKPLRVLLYGSDGIGKSTFGTGAPNPIVLDLEGGLGEIDTQSFDLTKADFMTVFDTVRLIYREREKLEVKTIIVDSLDWLETKIFNHVCLEQGVESIEKIGYAKGYVYAKDHWYKFFSALDTLRECGITIILLAHGQILKHEDPTLDPYDHWDIKLDKRIRGYVREWSDVVAFATPEIFTSKSGEQFGESKFRATGTGRRMMHLSEQPGFEAKSRLALPDVLPLDWSSFEDAVNESRGMKSQDNKKNKLKGTK